MSKLQNEKTGRNQERLLVLDDFAPKMTYNSEIMVKNMQKYNLIDRKT